KERPHGEPVADPMLIHTALNATELLDGLDFVCWLHRCPPRVFRLAVRHGDVLRMSFGSIGMAPACTTWVSGYATRTARRYLEPYVRTPPLTAPYGPPTRAWYQRTGMAPPDTALWSNRDERFERCQCLVADARHLLEIIDSFEWAVFLTILGNGLGLGRSNA